MRWLILVLAFVLGSPAFGKDNKLLHPKFPIVEGHYQLTEEWSVDLPEAFNRRIEDGQMVIWRPGFTIWMAIWNNDNNQSTKNRMLERQKDISKGAYDFRKSETASDIRFSYRLREKSEDKRVPALYGFVFGENGHAQVAIYFDKESDAKTAYAILQSVHEQRAP